MDQTVPDLTPLIAALDPLRAGQGAQPLAGSFSKALFAVGPDRILRLSGASLEGESFRFARVAGLPGVPRVLAQGVWEAGGHRWNYLWITGLPGRDAVAAWPAMTGGQRREFGRQAGAFLSGLHGLPAPVYDIGHYIPTVPSWTGSWREGHRRYWDGLLRALVPLPLGPELRSLLDRADLWFRDHEAALEGGGGPRVLHNDFHPKNLIADGGLWSGVIDWECSQGGEPDFDLAHLVHWAAFPPEPGLDLVPLVRGVLETAPAARVPRLAERLTMYQLEHEANQLVWSGGADQEVRTRRLGAWLEERVTGILGK